MGMIATARWTLMDLSKIQVNDKAPSEPCQNPSDEEMMESGIGKDDDDMPTPDDDGQSMQAVLTSRSKRRMTRESSRRKRARLAKEQKETEKENAQYKREPLRQVDPKAQLKKAKRNFLNQNLMTTILGFASRNDRDTHPSNGTKCDRKSNASSSCACLASGLFRVTVEDEEDSDEFETVISIMAMIYIVGHAVTFVPLMTGA